MGVLKPPNLGIPVHLEPTSICRALVGLADIDVVGVIGWTVPMQVHIASTLPPTPCRFIPAHPRSNPMPRFGKEASRR